ncbi:MAG: Fic family protein [Fibrobacteraceae bacterium]|nr:Fic family protein [Fibrobacteraceae bacterium]
MLAFLKDRLNDFNANLFVNDLVEASMLLGMLETKIGECKFNSVLMTMLHCKDAIASMYIEGVQTTITDVLENKIATSSSRTKAYIEFYNHISTLQFGEDYLKVNGFTNSFICLVHRLILLNAIETPKFTVGKYKQKDNRIVNSFGKIVFEPPSYLETKKYMDELIRYMNNKNDGLNPLIKAAIVHAQFEFIHPFEEGNGRVGRVLISLYFYRAGLIHLPYFYLSEAIGQDKTIYYNKLDSSRKNSYDEWISYFLKKVIVQAKKNIHYIDLLNSLYEKTRIAVRESVNSPKFDSIMECLFKQPVLTSKALADCLGVTVGQAKRYLETLEKKQILCASDRKRNKIYYFMELLDATRGF